MPQGKSQGALIVQQWRRHRVVIVEGPSGSGRSSAAFSAVDLAVSEGGRSGLVVQGARGPDLDDLRMWVATHHAVQRASDAASFGSRHGVVDDLHLLDDAAWGMLERLSRDEGTKWVFTVARGRGAERISALRDHGAVVVSVDTVDTAVATQIVERVWKRTPSQGVIDIMYELGAGRPGWIRRWAEAGSHVPAAATAYLPSEQTVYDWNLFQRLRATVGADKGLGEDCFAALDRISVGAATDDDRKLSLELGEAIVDPFFNDILIAVPLLRRIINMDPRDASPTRTSLLPAVDSGKRWLSSGLMLGALHTLSRSDGPLENLLRAECYLFLDRTQEARECFDLALPHVAELEPRDQQRAVALALAMGVQDRLAHSWGNSDLTIVLSGLSLLKAGMTAEACRIFDVGSGRGTQVGDPGLLPLRRALAAWAAALGDDVRLAYALAFPTHPSEAKTSFPPSPWWESLLGDLHAATALLLGEWGRSGIELPPRPVRAHLWLRNELSGWSSLAVVMGRSRGDAPLRRSIFGGAIGGLNWLHTLAKAGQVHADSTSPEDLSLVRVPQEPGLRRVLEAWRLRAATQSDRPRVASTLLGQSADFPPPVASTLSRAVEQLRALAEGQPEARSKATAALENLREKAGFGDWLKLGNAPSDLLGGLSLREREVCVELATGHTAAETARRLGISPRTVEKHAANAYRKLDITSRGDLVAAMGLPAPKGEIRT